MLRLFMNNLIYPTYMHINSSLESKYNTTLEYKAKTLFITSNNN